MIFSQGICQRPQMSYMVVSTYSSRVPFAENVLLVTSILATTTHMWQSQDSDLYNYYVQRIIDCFRGLFEEFYVEHEEVSKVLLRNDHKHETVTLNVLKHLMHGFIDVTEQQQQLSQ